MPYPAQVPTQPAKFHVALVHCALHRRSYRPEIRVDTDLVPFFPRKNRFPFREKYPSNIRIPCRIESGMHRPNKLLLGIRRSLDCRFDLFCAFALHLMADESKQFVFVCEVVVQGAACYSGVSHHLFERGSRVTVFCEMFRCDRQYAATAIIAPACRFLFRCNFTRSPSFTCSQGCDRMPQTYTQYV